MLNRTIRGLKTLAVTLAVLVVPPAVAARVPKTLHHCTVIGHANIVHATKSGVGEVIVATLDGRTCGRGAQVSTIRAVHASGGHVTEHATAIEYEVGGTLRLVFSFTTNDQADGTTTFAGHIRFNGGTGRYAGATGTGTLSGQLLPASRNPFGIVTLIAHTSVRY